MKKKLTYTYIKSRFDEAGYRELPRKPRPLVAGMNWQNNLKKTLDKF